MIINNYPSATYRTPNFKTSPFKNYTNKGINFSNKSELPKSIPNNFSNISFKGTGYSTQNMLNEYLHIYARRGNVLKMLDLMEAGASINAFDSDGNSVLFNLLNFCIEDKFSNFGKYINIIDYLVEESSNINTSNNQGDTLLTLLCKNYDQENHIPYKVLIEYLAKKSSNINKANNDGNTPLILLCQKFNPDSFTQLLKHKTLIEVLIQNGANINKADKNKNTPLNLVCKNFNPEKFSEYKSLVELLIKNGANINKADKEGNTPLLSLCKNFDPERHNQYKILYRELFQTLIQAGADVNKANKKGDTPGKLLDQINTEL